MTDESPVPQDAVVETASEEPKTTKGPIKLTDWPPLIHAWHFLAVSWFCIIAKWSGDWLADETASWLCSIFLIITMCIIMMDFRPVWFLVFIIALALVLAISKIMAQAEIEIPAKFWAWLTGLDPKFDPTDRAIPTTVITLLYLIMLVFQPFLNYWEVDHNEVRHVKGGRIDNTYTRQNYDFGSQYKDALEIVSTISAEFVIKEKGSSRIVASIDSVPLFPIRRHKIDDMLRTIAVVTRSS